MNTRQETILKILIDKYIQTAQPVSSGYIADYRSLDVSPATIRNEMMELEDEEYVQQPHTSAGRIPSIKGLQHYAKNLLTVHKLSSNEERRFRSIFKNGGLRELAKHSAHLTESAVILSFSDDNTYFTGFSELLTQPDFSSHELVCRISYVIDELESVLSDFVTTTGRGQTRIFLGSDNPLGDACAALFTRGKNRDSAVMGLISPLRTNYGRNVGVLNSINKYL